MSSLQRPRKIGLVGSDGQMYYFLCKPVDDMRKDCRVLEFYNMINKFFKRDAEARKRNLCEIQFDFTKGLTCNRHSNILGHPIE